MKHTRLMGVGVAAALLFTSGCLERELVSLNPCLVTGVARQIDVQSIDKVDLLFVVDNSNSMSEEQDALKAQFPKLIQTLTSGERADGTKFPAVRNLHLGVVSSDMGLAGLPNTFGCSANGGDDGLLQHKGEVAGCKGNYPNFLTFEYGQSNPADTAQDFACIATLGTGGCGFEQQLEAGLKALWPKQYVDASGKVYADNPIKFLSASAEGVYGHGDTPVSDGGNGGFLRNSARDGASLVAIVVVTDEEDCSSSTTAHFTADSSNPISKEPFNLRCYLHKQNLYNVERYVTGFKQLRPGNEHLVIFGAIAGVPTDLVNAEQRARFNDLQDDESRDAYYDAILNDPRMQEVPTSLTDPRANLKPSCEGVTAAGKPAPAYPPVRMVQVARAFGQNGVVQSICEKDFGPAMDAIIRAITDRIPSVCLPRPLIRNSDDVVPCNVIWELPPATDASTSAPTECEGVGTYLEPIDPNAATQNERGGVNCKVRQLPVAAGNKVPEGKGWYYDNFAEELATQCAGHPQRVSFTESAKPANGVIVKLECYSETQRVRSTDTRRMADQPEIGSECGEHSGSDSSCAINMKDGTQDDSLFCHPALNVCVQKCGGASDCPPAWVCDKRKDSVSQTGGQGFCVNPTCGSN